jgi:hypothetical protein
VLRGVATQAGVPLLLMDHYGKGELYVLAVPQEMNDLYSLPPPVLDALRRYLTPGLPVRLEGPAQVSLFEYGNGSFVVESYLDHPAAVRVIGNFAHLTNLTAGGISSGVPVPALPSFLVPSTSPATPQLGYELRIEPHSFVAFHYGN